jgi:hypothetical protein
MNGSRPARVLVPFGLIVAWLAILNVYVEHWQKLRTEMTEPHLLAISVGLIVAFVVVQTYWTLGLLHQSGFRGPKSAFTTAFLPLLYFLTLGVIVELSDINSLENPPFVIFCLLTLLAMISVPTFATGLSRTRAIRETSRIESKSSLPLRSVLGLASIAIFAFTAGQFYRLGDWRLPAVNAVFLAATTLLAVFASRDHHLRHKGERVRSRDVA